MGGADVGNQTQYSHLTGQFTYSLTFTASGLSLYDLDTHWRGTHLNILSDPQFQYSASTPVSPAQFALQAHILSIRWPTIGPILVQTMIDGQYQWTDHGGQTSIVPGISIAPRALDSLSLSFGLNIGVDHNPAGGLTFSVDPQPAASAWLTIPLP